MQKQLRSEVRRLKAAVKLLKLLLVCLVSSRKICMSSSSLLPLASHIMEEKGREAAESNMLGHPLIMTCSEKFGTIICQRWVQVNQATLKTVSFLVDRIRRQAFQFTHL